MRSASILSSFPVPASLIVCVSVVASPAKAVELTRRQGLKGALMMVLGAKAPVQPPFSESLREAAGQMAGGSPAMATPRLDLSTESFVRLRAKSSIVRIDDEGGKTLTIGSSGPQYVGSSFFGERPLSDLKYEWKAKVIRDWAEFHPEVASSLEPSLGRYFALFQEDSVPLSPEETGAILENLRDLLWPHFQGTAWSQMGEADLIKIKLARLEIEVAKELSLGIEDVISAIDLQFHQSKRDMMSGVLAGRLPRVDLLRIADLYLEKLQRSMPHQAQRYLGRLASEREAFAIYNEYLAKGLERRAAGRPERIADMQDPEEPLPFKSSYFNNGEAYSSTSSYFVPLQRRELDGSRLRFLFSLDRPANLTASDFGLLKQEYIQGLQQLESVIESLETQPDFLLKDEYLRSWKLLRSKIQFEFVNLPLRLRTLRAERNGLDRLRGLNSAPADLTSALSSISSLDLVQVIDKSMEGLQLPGREAWVEELVRLGFQAESWGQMSLDMLAKLESEKDPVLLEKSTMLEDPCDKLLIEVSVDPLSAP